nr:unnamed protein product [Digitaria exilis]
MPQMRPHHRVGSPQTENAGRRRPQRSIARASASAGTVEPAAASAEKSAPRAGSGTGAACGLFSSRNTAAAKARLRPSRWCAPAAPARWETSAAAAWGEGAREDAARDLNASHASSERPSETAVRRLDSSASVSATGSVFLGADAARDLNASHASSERPSETAVRRLDSSASVSATGSVFLGAVSWAGGGGGGGCGLGRGAKMEGWRKEYTVGISWGSEEEEEDRAGAGAGGGEERASAEVFCR